MAVAVVVAVMVVVVVVVELPHVVPDRCDRLDTRVTGLKLALHGCHLNGQSGGGGGGGWLVLFSREFAAV